MTEVVVAVTEVNVELDVSQQSPPTFTLSAIAGPSIVVGDTLGLSDLTPVTKTANYTAAANELVLVNATGGAVTIIVPTTSGAMCAVYKTDTSANTVTINLGSDTATLYETDQCRICVGDGTRSWAIANRNPYGYTDYVDSSTKTTSYTLVKTDAGTRIRYNSASAGTFTIPAFATVPWVDGTPMEFHTESTGQLTIAHATSSSHLHSVGSAFKSNGQYSTISALYVASGDIWDLDGNVTT